jgi:hypothetical protein
MVTATVVMAAASVLIAAFNFYYVWKFAQSVNSQRRSAEGQLVFSMSQVFFYNEPHKKIVRRIEGERVPVSAASQITEVELDDHIGFFDTLGAYVRARVLDADLVWEVFSHYIESAYEDPMIAAYVSRIRKDDCTIFSNFIWLYEEMKRITASKRKRS